MSHPVNTKYMLPPHYADEYPKFIQFMDVYFDWLYRTSEFSKEEIDGLLAEGISPADIMRLQSSKNPGRAANEMSSDMSLQREFTTLLTIEGEEFTTADGSVMEFAEDNSVYKLGWLQDMGFPVTSRMPGQQAYRNIDSTRLIKLLAHLYSIRGSVKCMELFFGIFHSGDTSISFPRESIATIDDNMVLDGGVDPLHEVPNVVRDDDFYSEYSYVVTTNGNPDANLDVFIQLYKDLFHPSGFKLFFKRDSLISRRVLSEVIASFENYRVAGLVTLPDRFNNRVDSTHIENLEFSIDKLLKVTYVNMPNRFNGVVIP
ncbi:hypothetical protein NVP1244A_202 [Vibrio phage 1.244.A._10N.261.54.C3]|nr:hypothetical protein NVP1244A_202 [Vibrio phage 1.244.A._10N.261.54.C3]AUR98830.1 hypothetical protein NVP1255O_202 [Vibrio phage 1.255.O._10N.286.45.F1]